MKIQQRHRDESIDVLRFLAISCIILAHIPPPYWQMYQLRNFDVPLMVFLSGVSFCLSGGMKSSYKQYIWKRTKRLIIPTWIFLSLYFTFYYVSDTKPMLTYEFVLRNYALIPNPIWYVWIIRVFFVIALLSPIICMLNQRLSSKEELTACSVALLLVEVLSAMGMTFLLTVCLETMAYSVIFCVGINAMKMTRKNIIVIATILLIVFVALFAFLYIKEGHVVLTQSYKYPPRIYYVSYAMSACLILYLIRNYIVKFLRYIRVLPLANFIGRHTLWIYFWHIFLLTILSGIENWVVKYITVYLISVSIVYLQSLIIMNTSTFIKNEKHRKDYILMFNS